jgi:hypothetical protein
MNSKQHTAFSRWASTPIENVETPATGVPPVPEHGQDGRGTRRRRKRKFLVKKNKNLRYCNTGFMDAPIFEGQTVTPHDFNTLRRIRDEDGSVIEEQEQCTELASNEAMLQLLRSLMETQGRGMREQLPDGIHSGLARPGQRGLFFYLTAPSPRGEGRQHFWRYYDLATDRILDNRFLIANLIACAPDTPRVVDSVDVFAIQDKVINHIVPSAREQKAVEAAPKIIDPIQQTASTLLRSYLDNPQLQRKDVKAAMQVLAAPLPRVHVKSVRQAYEGFPTEENEMLVS